MRIGNSIFYSNLGFFLLTWVLSLFDSIALNSIEFVMLYFLTMSIHGHLVSILKSDATVFRFNRQTQVNLAYEILELHLKQLSKTNNRKESNKVSSKTHENDFEPRQKSHSGNSKSGARTERELIILRSGISERAQVLQHQKNNLKKDINYLSHQPLESDVLLGEVVAF